LTHFSQFLVAAAMKMNVSTLHLTQVGYIPLYNLKNPKPVPKMLEDALCGNQRLFVQLSDACSLYTEK